MQVAEARAASAKAAEEAAAVRREAFTAMLQSKAALLLGARFSKVEALFFEDPRFEALPETQRQAVFADWQTDQRRAAEAEERAATELRVRLQHPSLLAHFAEPHLPLVLASSISVGSRAELPASGL